MTQVFWDRVAGVYDVFVQAADCDGFREEMYNGFRRAVLRLWI